MVEREAMYMAVVLSLVLYGAAYAGEEKPLDLECVKEAYVKILTSQNDLERKMLTGKLKEDIRECGLAGKGKIVTVSAAGAKSCTVVVDYDWKQKKVVSYGKRKTYPIKIQARITIPIENGIGLKVKQQYDYTIGHISSVRTTGTCIDNGVYAVLEISGSTK
jgi:hypothetical protein